jgi:hypothetical protein
MDYSGQNTPLASTRQRAPPPAEGDQVCENNTALLLYPLKRPTCAFVFDFLG